MDDLLKETISLILIGFFASFRDEGKIDEGDKEKMMLISDCYLIPYLSFVKENKTIFVLAQKKPELFHSKETLDFLYGNYFSQIMEKFGIPERERVFGFLLSKRHHRLGLQLGGRRMQRGNGANRGVDL